MENVPQMQKEVLSFVLGLLLEEWLQGYLQGGICPRLRVTSNKREVTFTRVKIRRYFVNSDRVQFRYSPYYWRDTIEKLPEIKSGEKLIKMIHYIDVKGYQI